MLEVENKEKRQLHCLCGTQSTIIQSSEFARATQYAFNLLYPPRLWFALGRSPFRNQLPVLARRLLSRSGQPVDQTMYLPIHLVQCSSSPLRQNIATFCFQRVTNSSGLYHRRKCEPNRIQQQSHEMAAGGRLLAPGRSSSVGFYVRQSGSGW